MEILPPPFNAAVNQRGRNLDQSTFLTGSDCDIFPNEDAVVRFVGAILLEQNDEWAVQRALYMTPETIAPPSDDPGVSLPALAG